MRRSVVILGTVVTVALGVFAPGVLRDAGRGAAAGIVGARYVGPGNTVFQRTETECGVAALAMVLNDIGRPVAYERLADAVGSRGQRIAFAELESVAASFGVYSRGLRISMAEIGMTPMPFVAHVDDHYVTVDSVRAGTVHLRDPGLGHLSIPLQDFGSWWTGAALVLTGLVSTTPRH